MPKKPAPPNDTFAKHAWKVFGGALVGVFAFRHASKTLRRQKVITVELHEGDTLGDLVIKYVGDYTDSNLDAVIALNKQSIVDINFLQPGDKIKVPDNRKPELATAEADWWRRRVRSGALKEPVPEPVVTVSEEPSAEEEKGSKKRVWGFGARKNKGPKQESKDAEPKNKFKLLQDKW